MREFSAARFATAFALTLASAPAVQAHSMGVTVETAGSELVVRVGFGKSMRPAPDVQVSLLDASRRTVATGVTDQDGVVRLPSPSKGRYRLEATDGVHEADAEIDVPNRDERDAPLAVSRGDQNAALRSAAIAGGLLAATVASFVVYDRRQRSGEQARPNVPDNANAQKDNTDV